VAIWCDKNGKWRHNKELTLQERRQEEETRRQNDEPAFYGNRLCPICGYGMMSAKECPKLRATIHLNHCVDCTYHDPIFWQCRYRRQEA
jgi:hypothetical protein